jgi:hypothetical protein
MTTLWTAAAAGVSWHLVKPNPHHGESMNRVTRAPLWAILAIGAILIVTPFAIGLPSKATAGQTMLDELHPLMQPDSVHKTVYYFDSTFVPLRPVAVGAVQAAGETSKLIGALATPLHMSPTQVQKFLGASFPATANLLQGLSQLAPIFANVPPGLTHYGPLVRAIRANVGNYAQVDSLPNLKLFTWILVIPGVLLVLLTVGPLLTARRVRVAAVSAHAT